MQNETKSRVLLTMLIGLVLSMTVLFAHTATSRAQTSSAAGSQPSATPVPADDALRAACNDAITELKAARKLIAAQDALIERDKELAALQDQIATGLKNLRVLDAEEKQKLRDAIAAADRQIAALEAEVVTLKKKRFTVWKAVKYVVIGAAAGVIGGVVLTRN